MTRTFASLTNLNSYYKTLILSHTLAHFKKCLTKVSAYARIKADQKGGHAWDTELCKLAVAVVPRTPRPTHVTVWGFFI